MSAPCCFCGKPGPIPHYTESLCYYDPFLRQMRLSYYCDPHVYMTLNQTDDSIVYYNVIANGYHILANKEDSFTEIYNDLSPYADDSFRELDENCADAIFELKEYIVPPIINGIVRFDLLIAQLLSLKAFV